MLRALSRSTVNVPPPQLTHPSSPTPAHPPPLLTRHHCSPPLTPRYYGDLSGTSGTCGGDAPLTCLEVLGELFRIEGAELMQEMALQVGLRQIYRSMCRRYRRWPCRWGWI